VDLSKAFDKSKLSCSILGFKILRDDYKVLFRKYCNTVSEKTWTTFSTSSSLMTNGLAVFMYCLSRRQGPKDYRLKTKLLIITEQNVKIVFA